MSANYAEEIRRRLPPYREAAFTAEDLGTSLAFGELFAELCEIENANFAAFGTNVFVRVRDDACNVLESLEIDFATDSP